MKDFVVNETSCNEVYKEDVEKICKITLKKLKVKKPVFNVIFVDNKTIRDLNKKYRKIDRETDVISFALEDNEEIIYDKVRLLGDIYISIEKAKEQALEYGHSLKREVCFLTVHGLLHLLGYDHIKEEDRIVMRSLEECVLNSYDVKR